MYLFHILVKNEKQIRMMALIPRVQNVTEERRVHNYFIFKSVNV